MGTEESVNDGKRRSPTDETGKPMHRAMGWDMHIITNTPCRVRTLTGKEIELDIEADYKVRLRPDAPPASTLPRLLHLRTTCPPTE